MFKSIYTAVLLNKQKFLGKGSGSIIDLLTEHNINISKYNPLDGSSCIKLPKELDHPRKGLISIQNINDNECFKRSIVRYSNPADRNPARITKTDKYFATKLDFKDEKFPVKIRDIHKIEKKNSIGISVFGYENKEKHPVYVSKKCCEEKHVDILLIQSEGKRHYVLITDFDTFMYDHTLHRGRKHFCRYWLQAFSEEEILKRYIKDCFKINGRQRIVMPKKASMFNSKIMRKIKSLFMILVSEDNGKQNPKEFCTNKYQMHITCSYGYKLVCVDDKINESF